MAKRRVTKIDPRKELSPYINHQSTKNKRKRILKFLPHFLICTQKGDVHFLEG